ncbi:MAG: hypothetical protein OXI63_15560 [Candidatus Poribacteria bacterium]|nr:hypothetical protein [Candidatus Poribacteria bacterium]
MSETAFALANNKLQNSSGSNENSIESFDQSLRQWLRERHAGHIETTLKQSRNKVRDTEIIETKIEDRATSIEIGSDISSIVNFLDLTQDSQTWHKVTFHALQEWEGYVIEIGEDDFTVLLLDLTAGSTHEEEEAVIPLAEISEDDLKRLRPGSIFRWVIGYERSASGTKRRVSAVVFRELPVVTKQDIVEAEARARKTAQLWAE